MQIRNIQRDIITILSKLAYEPVSENDLNKPNNINCTLFYRKELAFDKISPIEIFLNFFDDSLLSFPSVYISISQLDKLKKQFPHIQEPIPHLDLSEISYKQNELFSICYQLHNSNIIPRTDLLKLISIVERHLYNYFSKIVDKQKYIKEYSDDFGGIIISLFHITNLRSDNWYLINSKKNITLLYKNNNKYQPEENVFTIKINNSLTPDFSGLIDYDKKVTISRFINFINLWDKVSYNQLMRHLKKNQQINRIIIYWRQFTFGIEFSWLREEKKGLKSICNKDLLKNPITFYITKTLDLKASIMRNLPDKSNRGLLDKRLFQIGLGAIGGYMADALIKIGAGFENDFIIIDDDIFENENAGRHLLGIQYIGMNKAYAYEKYIEYQNPIEEQIEKIIVQPRNIKDYSHEYFIENNINLIIDATGSIEVQEYINEMVQKIPLNCRPIILHLWIYGNGECVQGLWVHPKEQHKIGGCISCLGSSGTGLYADYLPVINSQVEQRTGVCSAFTPYTISGGMMAACLGINMILEWLATGKVKNNYQTRYNSEYRDKKIDDIKLLANPLCPFCGDKYE